MTFRQAEVTEKIFSKVGQRTFRMDFAPPTSKRGLGHKMFPPPVHQSLAAFLSDGLEFSSNVSRGQKEQRISSVGVRKDRRHKER